MNGNQWSEKLTKLLDSTPKSDAQVANEIGISRSALCQYKMGGRFPKRETAKKIATYFGKTVEEIFYA